MPSLVYQYSRHLFLIHGGPSAKVGWSAKFGVAVFKASILNSLGTPSAKVSSSAKFGVVVFKASILNSLGKGGSICHSIFICKFWCTHIQGISALFPGEVHLPRLALTTILHITPAKYESS